jgi:uncharacterized protein
MSETTTQVISRELGIAERGVGAVVRLLGEGATVPFVARYRKEATGGLDEVQIRAIEERDQYLRELAARKETILEEIQKQGKLTDELRRKIEACLVKAELEDLYLPYKPKRRTRAMIARERGLEPLAQRILAQPSAGSPGEEALGFVAPEKGVATADLARQGARDIVAEVVAELATVRAFARDLYAREGVLAVSRREGSEGATKYETYYDFREPLATMPSHRFLAVRRGESENVLVTEVLVDDEKAVDQVGRLAGRNPASPWCVELDAAVADSWKRLLSPSIEADVRAELKLRADHKAVEVFAQNLRALLLAPPFGGKVVVGIDPGQRTGCKVAVVDETGKLLEHAVFYLVQGGSALERSRQALRALVEKYRPAAVAVGNGTHGRETEAFVREVLGNGASAFAVLVSESGASVYSASEVAREELPDLDLTVRGAVSIARRLQDPLAELVKVDPKSIGVGQYQHDVHEPLLVRKLEEVVESCVNQVGVELNTSSAPLLSYVAGIGPALARKIVQHRDQAGRFRSRAALQKVSGVGPKTFEQAAGFLRIRGGENPLDASAVHPERYPVVVAMARDLGVGLSELVGNGSLISRIDWRRYLSGDLGEPTLRDILAELAKPGRDPRADFEPPRFREDVRTLEDLQPGMEIEGVVTNVTAFGAFVDVGVHQDGLVHLSQLADRFVGEASEVVRPGDRLKVRILEVDLVRRRISLSARSGAPRQAPGTGDRADARGRGRAGEARRGGKSEGGQPAGQKADGGPGPKPVAGGAGAGQPERGNLRHNPFAGRLKR